MTIVEGAGGRLDVGSRVGPAMTTVKPDFFIVGAPKCGTTAMSDYFRQHPSVDVVTKDLHYFAPDLRLKKRPKTEQEYLAHFDAVREGRRGCDCSVYYLYSRWAAREIKAFQAEARIIAMLRNPVEMIHSLHSQLLFVGAEDLIDFEAAVDADVDRRNGYRLPPGPVLAQAGYRGIAGYTAQLRRYYETFGRDRVHTVIFDDFAADPLRSYEAASRFLDLEPRPVEVRVINPNKVARSGLVRSIVESPPVALRGIGHAVLPAQAMRRRLASRVKAFNTRYEARVSMAPELRMRLCDEFAPEVERLSELLGRDLTSWSRKPAPAGSG